MAVQTVDVGALDPNLCTGPTRLIVGPVRTGDVTLDTYYGDNGTLEYASRLYVGTSGDVTYVTWDGGTQTLQNLAAGIWHVIYSIRVNTTGTTATDIVWGS